MAHPPSGRSPHRARKLRSSLVVEGELPQQSAGLRPAPHPDLPPLEGSGVVVRRGAQPRSADTTLRGLELSGMEIGAADPATSGHAAGADSGVTGTTVTAMLASAAQPPLKLDA